MCEKLWTLPANCSLRVLQTSSMNRGKFSGGVFTAINGTSTQKEEILGADVIAMPRRNVACRWLLCGMMADI
jgi:hypothetical protein